MRKEKPTFDKENKKNVYFGMNGKFHAILFTKRIGYNNLEGIIGQVYRF